MSKYSEMEIQIAKNLMGKGYKWMAKDYDGALYAFRYEPYKDESVWCEDKESEIIICSFVVPIFQNIKWKDSEPTYIEDIISPQILDEAERQYLSAVIRPFRDEVQYIVKTDNGCHLDYCQLRIGFPNASDDIYLPCFRESDMYKGMKLGWAYSLRELRLNVAICGGAKMEEEENEA